MSKKNVSAAVVREWARQNIDLIPEAARAGLGENARGRLHPEIRTAFAKANKGKAYEPKVAESPTLTVPVTTLDKAGRKTTVKRTLTTAEARTALGQPTSKRGRIPMGVLSEALSAVEAEKVADTFK